MFTFIDGIVRYHRIGIREKKVLSDAQFLKKKKKNSREATNVSRPSAKSDRMNRDRHRENDLVDRVGRVCSKQRIYDREPARVCVSQS